MPSSLSDPPSTTDHLWLTTFWFSAQQPEAGVGKKCASELPIFFTFHQILVICAAWSWWRQKCVPWNYQFFPPPIATDLSPWIQTKVPLSTFLLPSSLNAIHEKDIVRNHKVAKIYFQPLYCIPAIKKPKCPLGTASRAKKKYKMYLFATLVWCSQHDTSMRGESPLDI